MTGYHYTSYSNWLRIQHEGIVPYPIKRLELAIHFDDLYGIWLWPDQLSQEDEMWFLMSRAATFPTLRLVKLQVRFESDALLTHPDYDNVNISHAVEIGNYHSAELPCIITTRTIPPEDITLLRDFNFLHLNPPDLGVAVDDESQTADHLS